MKLSSIITTLLAVSPLTQASLLRSKEATFKTSKVQIVVQGVPQDFSKQDLTVINKSAISAYNAVQETSRYSLVAIHPVLHFGGGDSPVGHCRMCPPDDDTFFLGEEQVLLADVEVLDTPVGHCRMCPPDDDAVALEESSNHQLFEQTFCNLLAVSGSPNLAKAHDCAFSFLEEPGHGVAPLSLMKHEKSSHHHGFLSVTGLLHDLSAADVAIVESATLETFNQAFANDAGYSKFDDLHVRSAVSSSHPVGHCRMCPPDDDTTALTALTGSILLLDIDFADPKDKGVGHCRMCPPDDDSVEIPSFIGQCMMCPPNEDAVEVKHCMMCPPDDDAVVNAPSVRREVLAFSNTLCMKLRESGSPNLALAGDCTLDFFYEHKVGGEETA